MAEHYGVSVRAFNVSLEQIEWAREQAKHRGLESRVEFVLDDYRNAGGPFDVFASVGMLEHVGTARYRALGHLVERHLAPGGRGLLHFIGRAEPTAMNAWFERRIFPGSYLPALSEALSVLEPCGLVTLDVENLRRHYARTLEHWLDRFEKAAARIEAMTDAAFVRAWRLYLCGSLAAFRIGSCELFQVLFARRGADVLPWTRHYQYAAGAGGDARGSDRALRGDP
jgi:cyclopropane-fatty-acyl-phospholipid synthase